MKKTKIIVMLTIALLFLTSCGNGIIGGTTTNNDITILTTAVVGTPTTKDDPYKKYIKDNYGLNATLMASSDFNTTALLQFSDVTTSPDIVAFSSIDSFRTIFNQGVLLNDWTPYLKDMPNFSKIIAMEDSGREGKPSIAKMMLTENEQLTGLWTLPDPPSWSLKVREDWASEFRKTAGNENWQPDTPESLLDFARWIKVVKNEGKAVKDCFGFSTAGCNKDFGTLGNWVPLMFGAVCELPWGLYFDDEGNVDFGVTDGNHKKMLDFIKTIIDEELIEPNWYYQTADKKTTTKGKIGIDWYPGSISEETQAYFSNNKIIDEATGKIVDTTNWWKTYPVPKDVNSERGGYQPSDGFFGLILTVSNKAANDETKMKKIIKLLDDLAITKTINEDGSIIYNRTKAYDALRWGVGVEPNLKYQDIAGSNAKYIYVDNKDKTLYRGQYPGAWDWGTFFRSTDDGIIQGSVTKTVSDLTSKVIEHNDTTSGFKRKLQFGGVLKLNISTVATLTSEMKSFEYTYVTGKNAMTYAEYLNSWKSKGGTTLIEEASAQFKELGFIA